MTKENKQVRESGKYRVSVVEQKTERVLWQRHFTKPLLWLSILAAVLIGAALVWCLIAFTPLRATIPGYPDARTRNMAVQNALKIDSLERMITRWDLYAENLRRVVEGEEPLNIDSVLRVKAPVDSLPADAAALAQRDSLLRQEVTRSQGLQDGKGRSKVTLEGRHFIPPLKGVVSAEYDPLKHPYLDISAPAGSPVVSVLDGTVVFAGWSDEMGYTIGVQHAGDLLTFYKRNQKLLKAVGDKVTAGTSIALVGQTGSAENATTGDHLHFELWYGGEPVNPVQYINF
jgi:murein DD-endopeptidase MepM/ murein hydrolase activator NlpD